MVCSFRFDPPEEVWLLSHQPDGVLPAILTYLEQLTKKLSSIELREVVKFQPSSLLEDAVVVAMVLARVASNLHNYSQVKLRADDLTGCLHGLLCALHQLVRLY